MNLANEYLNRLPLLKSIVMFSDLAFTGTQVLMALFLIPLGLIGFILFGRYRLNKITQYEIAHRAEHTAKPTHWANRSKLASVDVLRNTDSYFNVGLIVALALAVLALGYTQFEEKTVIPQGAMEMDIDIEMAAPPQTATPPPPPPPPPPVIEAVPDEQILVDDQTTFSDQSANADMAIADAPIAIPEKKGPVAPPPPPPPPPAIEVKEIFKVVEEMPRFPGCEDLSTVNEKKACAQEKLLKFIYDNIKYPSIARENNVSGTVVVQFVVESDGSIGEAQILRDIGAKCGEEAMRIVKLMKDMPERWTPGKQRGHNVPVYFILPVKFVLVGNEG
jgi:protein TonB